MLRVRTLYAASAGVTAAYYTQYLSESPDDVPGVWTGHQAAALGLTGTCRPTIWKRSCRAVTPRRGHRSADP